ncbi:MAG: hypothetical protein GY775_02415 [Candidatus Scalindua sp.]|nr:hypothetical protein [Candidatus Scalindua sp.]
MAKKAIKKPKAKAKTTTKEPVKKKAESIPKSKKEIKEERPNTIIELTQDV